MAPPKEGIPKDSRPTIKVILVGNSGVGKTWLITSFFKQSLEGRVLQTVAPAYSCREVRRSDGKIVILQIWDTAGQERYSSISQLFYRESRVALVCFDPGDESSLSAVRDWVKKVLREADGCHLFAVLTKVDRIPQDEVEVVLNQAKESLADTGFEQWFVTSALLRTGVDEVFQRAAERCTLACQATSSGAVVPEPNKTACC
jgi:small GTP-binding protein